MVVNLQKRPEQLDKAGVKGSEEMKLPKQASYKESYLIYEHDFR
jgi:hypothetical protein